MSKCLKLRASRDPGRASSLPLDISAGTTEERLDPEIGNLTVRKREQDQWEKSEFEVFTNSKFIEASVNFVKYLTW